MLVECPNCHRRYEPKPNEKYCPCCGEEIKEPLKNIEPEQPKVESKPAAVPYSPRPRYGKLFGTILSFAGVIGALLSFVFAFGNVFGSSSTNLFQLTFYSTKSSSSGNAQPQYVGLIIAFVIYVIFLLVCLYEIYKLSKNEANNARFAIGALGIFLVLFYVIYIAVKFKMAESGSSSSYYGTYYAFGDGLTRFLIVLGLASVFNIISPIIENNY